jgi:hypothetical protein
VYDIQQGNTNDEIKFYMGYNEENGKSREDSLELRILYFFFESQELCTTKVNALGELVKCKTSKTILPPKISGKLDSSRFLTGFQKVWPDMSGP